MSVQRTIRLPDEIDARIMALQKLQNRKSWSETASHVLTVGLECEGAIHFNRACTLLGVTSRREAFSQWRQKNDVPTFATLAEWENYMQAFETDGDARDLHDTQEDALI